MYTNTNFMNIRTNINSSCRTLRLRSSDLGGKTYVGVPDFLRSLQSHDTTKFDPTE